jgi:hypothetical protein
MEQNFSIIRVCGRSHVIREVDRPNVLYRDNVKIVIPDPNYMNTGKALCGILKIGQTLEEWKEANLY